MRKMMTMAVVAMFATSAFAQNPDAFKQIKKAKTADEVSTLISANEASMSASENAQAYNKLVDIAMSSVGATQATIQANSLKEQMGQEVTDKVDMKSFYNDLYVAYVAALKCDKYDSQPNEKGKVPLKFRKSNGDRLYNYRPYLVNGGQDAQTAEDNKTASQYYGMYVATAKSDLFKTQVEAANKAAADGVGDQYLSEVARVAALTTFNEGDLRMANFYADVVMEDKAKEKEGLNLKLYFVEQGIKTHADSLRCLGQLKEMYDKYPADSDVFARLAQWYANLGENEKQSKLISERLQSDPKNFTAWAMKGQSEMNALKYDEAITSYKEALTCETNDPLQKALIDTFLGYCYTQKSTQLDKYDDQVNLLKEAIPYLEEAKSLDPNRDRCNWAYPLYNCYYYVKGEKDAQTLELKDLLGL